MAASPRTGIKINALQSTGATFDRVSVYDLFQRHVRLLAGLPGEASQFDQTGFGFEWRCECQLGSTTASSENSSGESQLMLQFSLVDMKDRAKPAAVLYLLELAHQDNSQLLSDRILVPLDNMSKAHDALFSHMSRKLASIGAMECANHFITGLSDIRSALDAEVNWTAEEPQQDWP